MLRETVVVRQFQQDVGLVPAFHAENGQHSAVSVSESLIMDAGTVMQQAGTPAANQGIGNGRRT